MLRRKSGKRKKSKSEKKSLKRGIFASKSKDVEKNVPNDENKFEMNSDAGTGGGGGGGDDGKFDASIVNKGRTRTLSVPEKPLRERFSVTNRGRLQSTFNADPGKLILDWTFQFDIPEWVDSETFTKCHSCSESFATAKHKRHNCRLCGGLFCSLCTGKYYVPDQFHLKNKRGAVRVCWGCRDKCLRLRSKTRPQLKKPNIREKLQVFGRNKIGAPVEWTHASEYKRCFCCFDDDLKSRHHCRICGELFCRPCMTKLYLPLNFRKKGNMGASRVCLECRYIVNNGFELDPGDVSEYQGNFEDEELYGEEYESSQNHNGAAQADDHESSNVQRNEHHESSKSVEYVAAATPEEIVDELLDEFEDSSGRPNRFSIVQ